MRCNSNPMEESTNKQRGIESRHRDSDQSVDADAAGWVVRTRMGHLHGKNASESLQCRSARECHRRAAHPLSQISLRPTISCP